MTVVLVAAGQMPATPAAVTVTVPGVLQAWAPLTGRPAACESVCELPSPKLTATAVQVDGPLTVSVAVLPATGEDGVIVMDNGAGAGCTVIVVE